MKWSLTFLRIDPDPKDKKEVNMNLSRILLVILLFIILNGCINQKHTGPLTYFEKFTVEFEELPLLNKPVNLNCTITQWDFDAEAFLESDIVIEVELPEGFELVDGTLTWQGHVDPNQTVTHTITLKAVKPGKWTISVRAGPSQNPRFDVENLYITVTETSAEVSTEPFRKSMIIDANSHTGSLSYFKDFNVFLSNSPMVYCQPTHYFHMR